MKEECNFVKIPVFTSIGSPVVYDNTQKGKNKRKTLQKSKLIEILMNVPFYLACVPFGKHEPFSRLILTMFHYANFGELLVCCLTTYFTLV